MGDLNKIKKDKVRVELTPARYVEYSQVLALYVGKEKLFAYIVPARLVPQVKEWVDFLEK